MESPFQFFKYFFTNELIDFIAKQSYQYSVQTNPDRPVVVTSAAVKKYVGICIFTSLVHVPNIRDYWDLVLGNTSISSVMSVNQFEKIRRYLNLCNNAEMLTDNTTGYRLFKLRPVFEALRAKFLSVPMEECLALDEQMCSTKARHYLKQYMPNKLHKGGYKFFVLSGVSGYAYDIEIYTGQENDPSKRKAGEPDWGTTVNVVVRLMRHIPKNARYKLYFDNYYICPKIMVHLAEQGILSLNRANESSKGLQTPNRARTQ
ncbi:piggyBac transposable element-derived protein 4-like [Ixodes scapularis]|uniref:piggyBac transposable element-derived protein 4-like n=1 Tax=Ixodes scapularis TaxID=6945 RepID=UPI001C38204E|nr:piggyBac transposable element-derived protein 4-like [Ixodes scapularis]XP_042142664.1 piggyBac transposable element-derived protein 4-like [Ixodes scapularis]